MVILNVQEERELDFNLNEFHEVCELHSTGVLIEVEYYDSVMNKQSAVGYLVTTKTVENPHDIMHVFDHVAQRHRTPVGPNATNVSIEFAQNMITQQRAWFTNRDEAIDYALAQVRKIAIDRCYNS